MYELIAAFCVLGIIIVALFGVKGIYQRDETITGLKVELSKEKEKVRLLYRLQNEI